MQGGEQEGSTAWVVVNRISHRAAASGQFFQQSHADGIAGMIKNINYSLLSFFVISNKLLQYLTTSWSRGMS
jgi:hypothetical protein